MKASLLRAGALFLALSALVGLEVPAQPQALVRPRGASASTQQPQGVGSGGAVQMGIKVVPETVTVGDPFDVELRIRAPRGAVVDFPTAPDSGRPVELQSPVVVSPNGDTAAVDQTARYRVVAWDIGTQAIRFAPIQVHVGSGVRRVTIDAPTVFVRSVLPSDSAQRIPKPARDLFAQGPPWWWPWLPIVIAAAIVGRLLWLWWRRRRKRPVAVPDPFDVAEAEFARVESLGLVEAGERGRHVALMTEVLRVFLAARLDVAHPSLTSTELLVALRPISGVPLDRLHALLDEADLVKFARRPLPGERARTLGREAREIVRAIARPVPPASLAAAA